MKKRPKICLSLNCETMDEIRQEIDEYKDFCQLVEWRADKALNMKDMSRIDVRTYIKEIKKVCRGKKIIFTCRGDEQIVNRMLRYAIGYADFVDIEADNSELDELIKFAKRKRTKTIISYHNFCNMPSRNEIAEQFLKMERTKGNIIKIAALAENEDDCYNMLEGASAYNSLKKHKPFIAIAMGQEGQTSRICAGDFGSVISYACGSKTTAPGQFDARSLSQYMDRYYKNKKECVERDA